MKKYVLMLILLIPMCLFADDKKNYPEIEKKINSIEKDLNEFKSKYNENYFKSRIEILNNTIEYQNKVISGTNTFITIISILLGILTIILPIITYLFGIKPSQEKIKDLDKTFASFINNINDENIDSSVNNLKSEDVQIRQNASLYLSLNPHYNYSENQIFKLIKILKNETIEENIKNVIKHLISLKWSEYAESYFNELTRLEIKPTDIYYLAKFYSIKGINNYIPQIVDLIKADKNNSFLLTFISQLVSISEKELKFILNNKDIINSVSADSLKNIDNLVKNYCLNLFKKDMYSGTYLHEKMQMISNDQEVKSNFTETVSPPSEEDFIRNKGLIRQNGKIMDNNGNIYETTKYVQTFMGPKELFDGINIDGRIISIDKIKNDSA